MCSDHPFPCTISAICSSCRTLIVDAPATPAIERHEEQVTKLAAFASTPKSLPRQLRPPRISTHYRLSVGSAFSVPSSSSQEEQVSMYLPEGERERRNLETLNNAMAVITDGNFTSLPHYVDCKWEALSGASKEEFIIRADEVVSYVLNTIAPSQQEQLWEGVVKRRRSVEDKINNITIDVGLEAILLAYNECSNRLTKTQILSLISDRFSQSELQQLLPGISLRQVKNARKHALEQGRGEPKTRNEIFRCRLNMEKVRDFIEFFSRSTFLQDVAFGTKTLKLSSGERIPIPSVVRTMTASKIIYLYHEECREHDVEPLKERTCFRLLEVCSASKQKSLQGLDNTSTTGEEAFETIASLVENLGQHGAGATWTRDTLRSLSAGKNYLKSVYKSHLGPEEACADHCTVFALSDPFEERFSGECCHDHNQACPECKGIVDVLEAIEDTLRNGDLDLSEKQKERARWDLDHAVSSIDAWKAHLLRTFQQDQARQDTLNRLDDQTIMVINDWAMKLLPMRFRETQSQWFAKRGISWHFSAVVHKSNHPDCPVVSASEHTIHTYVVAIDSCKQDWFSVSCILEEVLVCVKESHQSVCRAILRSDNAGCYHCSALLSTINSTSRRSGIEVIRYDFSDPQSGKDLCDRKIAPCKQRLRHYVAENHNVESAKDIKKGLESPPGIAGTSIAECKIDQSAMSTGAANNKIPGITKYNNFSLTSKSMRVWQAYNVGEGVDIKGSWHEQDVSGLERIGEWTKKIPRVTQKKYQAKGKHDVTESVNTFSCLEPACIATFKTIEEADEHMDTGHHIMTPEKESIYDNVRRQWAAVTTSVKGAGQKIGRTDYVPVANLRLSKGWALKKTKAAVRISSGVKEFLTNLFNKGAKDLHQKAMPADVVEQIKETFPVSEWVEVQTVKGYFSRLASQQKGLPVSEEEGEDEALEKEDYMEQLVGVAEQEIGLKHPLVYDDFNFCDLSAGGRLAKVLEKQKLSQLQSFCEYFDVEISGRANRKASYYEPLIQLANSCDCRK